ncbi:baseplate J/gp47 family protein [Paeniglutamicibacter sp. R2-26]|uniref:baseplate J/gp47 family protein n=1 Tax=Paeniglutamicibacter sp. R2-26 TaxID=3144417 RepID=UPI003EE7B0DE
MIDEESDIPELETLNLLEFGGEQDIVTAAVEHAQNALPEWQPRAGNTELVLIESLALIMGVEALSIQMLPNQIVEQLMGLYGVTRNPGLPSTGKILFRVTNSSPMQVIPAGTRLRYELEATDETVDFLTLDTLTIATAETLSGQVMIGAEEVGVEGNNIPVGAEFELVTQLPFIESVSLTEATRGGEGEEPDNDFTARAAAVLSRSNNTLVLPENFTAAAISDPTIGRARTLDLYNPTGTPKSPAVGHVTVAVVAKDGEPLTPGAMETMRQSLSNQALASLQVHVVAPTYTTVNLAVAVAPRAGFQPDEVQATVEDAIRAWVNPETWDWSPTVDQYALIGVVHDVAGVRTVTSASPTVPLAGDVPLPRLGTLTVAVS